MPDAYVGPVRSEPLPVELHNTLYAVRGQLVDGLGDEDGLRMWLAALGDRIPRVAGDELSLESFRALRGAVRDVLRAVARGERPPIDAVAELNHASTASPRAARLGQDLSVDHQDLGATGTDVVLGRLAAATIELVGGAGAQLKLCGAPGCVLMYFKDHPRRGWCSTECGNRARQARHYARTKSSSARRGHPAR
jgi:predicted RNA-binding Zn ribbon-like protein